MKALRSVIIILLMVLAGVTQAQVSVSINIGSPPPWGPAGYASVRYYYLPDVEAYYDVQSSMFIYFGGGAWIRRAHLPSQYRYYNLYSGYKVVMPDYHGNTPYSHFKEHKMKYARGYHGKPQRTNGQKPGSGYSGGNRPPGGNPGNQGGGHGNGKGDKHGNEKNSKGNHGHDGGNGKKK
jgi:hypothetical protein